MHYRPLTPDDAPAFVALRLAGLQDHPEAFASSYEEESSTPLTEIRPRLEAGARQVVVGAFDGPSLIGVAGLEREAMAKLSHKAGLWGMYIAPSARGRGIGAALIQTALNYAASAWGVRQVNLRVNTRNQSAVALYLKLGFVQFGLEHDSLLINGEYHDEYEMAYVVRSAA